MEHLEVATEQGPQPGTAAHDRAARLEAVEDCKRLARVKACSECNRFRRTGCVWAQDSGKERIKWKTK